MSKSEELCKLLGIKPEYIYETFITAFKADSNKVERFKIFICGQSDFKKYYACSCNPKVIKVIKKYPDLTKPSNFVKLLGFIRMLMFIRCNNGVGFNYKSAIVADINCDKYSTLEENFIQAFIWAIQEEVENFENYENDKEIQEHLDALKSANNVEWDY